MNKQSSLVKLKGLVDSKNNLVMPYALDYFSLKNSVEYCPNGSQELLYHISGYIFPGLVGPFATLLRGVGKHDLSYLPVAAYHRHLPGNHIRPGPRECRTRVWK